MSSRPSLDEVYIGMLDLVASRSTCVRRKVGAIVVQDGKVIGMGYNGVPHGIRHCIDHPCLGAKDMPGNNTKCEAIHAEQNAILHSNFLLVKGAVIYTSTTPCFNCAKLIITAGIKRVVSKTLYSEKSGIRLMAQAGIIMEIWEPDYPCAIPMPQHVIDEALSE